MGVKTSSNLHVRLPEYFRPTKKYHLEHHFANYQLGFGVTNKFWDRVFGTELIYTDKTQ